MKNVSKKIICSLLAVLMLLSLAACGDTTSTNESSTTNGSTNVGLDVENGDTVVGSLNGKDITRSEVGDSLLSAEQNAISSYMYTLTLKEFFKDVEVTKTELELQLEVIKNQVGEDSWDMYLMYYGGGNEETFRTMLEESLKQEKYIKEKMDTLTIDDSELSETYNKEPDYYNIAVLDVIFFGDVDELNTAKAHYATGMDLEAIAKEMELEVYANEHTYYKSVDLTWEKNFADCKVGDYIFSAEDSGSLVIGRIKELNEGVDNPTVKADMIDNMKYDKAFELVNDEYMEFLKTQNAVIFGESYPLYEEETTSGEIITETEDTTESENHDHDGDGTADH